MDDTSLAGLVPTRQPDRGMADNPTGTDWTEG